MKPFAVKTKIIATVGPSSSNPRRLRQLMAAGVNGFRLNLSHGNYNDHAEVIAGIRILAAAMRQPVAVLVDLPGPKLRLARLAAPVAVRRGEQVCFLPAGVPLPAEGICLPHEIEGLAERVRPGMLIHVADGMVQFRVKAVHGPLIETEALVAGVVQSGKGVNVPGYEPPGGVLTPADRRGLAFAAAQRVDAVCVSFVGGSEELLAARAVLGEPCGHAPALVAKIERPQGVERLPAILAAADAVMVARGDLGIELPIEEVPVLQKEIVRRANLAAKPVIVATQMLLSMVDHARPTRAEVTDVANAILDGADAVMFSEETAIGRDPALVVRTARKIARRTERALPALGGSGIEAIRKAIRGAEGVDDLICSAAFDILENHTVDLAVTPTASGATTRRIARLRPRPWIVAVTDNQACANFLCLSFGVAVLLVPDAAMPDSQLAGQLKAAGLIQPGQRMVITSGSPFGVAGTTNSLRILDVC
ncbi:MAG: pyruvate kinase [Thermodesulfobacteriota bacterium]